MKKERCAECGDVDRPSPSSPHDSLFPELDGHWRCKKCKRNFHWFCSGASDDLPDLCDDCYCEEHKEAA